ncbi:hypothetical protein D6850_04905 [Roseovarius spongiae]|uniref:Sulfotransferase family protein n=1 Tax=Roseovarius spongiae TaxID=2320272 RepID=A0A3A8AWV9_9RHOB|nr:hypothetical protein [Roseovarius spongiae]RKF16873.1 hypothetical protein D6850_04905 [Roseovarius spongiae]
MTKDIHPIIALWSHPRSMSTATERIMRERGDLDCVHEPFMYDYYVHRRAGEMPHLEVDPDLPVSYEDIRAMLLARAGAGPVFFKDMSYYVTPRLLDDVAFRDRMRHAFLIRDPRAAIVSYHKIDPGVSEEEVGIAAQWEHYQGLVAAGHAPPVIRSEDIRNDPRATMAAFWDAIGLSPAPHAFEWGEVMPEDWNQVEGWHGRAAASNSIEPLPGDYYEKAEAAFEARARDEPRLRDLLAAHLPAYERLAERALKPAA